jgi:hypothetical protein
MKKLLLSIVLILVLVSCSSIEIKVSGLKATPMEVKKGGKVVLSWDIESNTDLNIMLKTNVDNAVLFDNLPKVGEKEIILNETTTFILEAKNKKGVLQKIEGNSQITVKVIK